MEMPEILEENMTAEQKILWSLTSLHTVVNTLQERQEKHHKVLIEGNGDLPLVERVRNMEKYIDGTKYWLRFLVGALLIQTVAFLGTAITYFLRLYPLLLELSNK